jgi:hypothetical protein
MSDIISEIATTTEAKYPTHSQMLILSMDFPYINMPTPMQASNNIKLTESVKNVIA